MSFCSLEELMMITGSRFSLASCRRRSHSSTSKPDIFGILISSNASAGKGFSWRLVCLFFAARYSTTSSPSRATCTRVIPTDFRASCTNSTSLGSSSASRMRKSSAVHVLGLEARTARTIRLIAIFSSGTLTPFFARARCAGFFSNSPAALRTFFLGTRMRIIHEASQLNPGNRKVCLAIGFFDGVHLGHQQIIRQTITDARRHGALALVISFDLHPNTIVAPARVPPLIYSLPQKLRAIESLGPDALLLIHFDKPFSQKTGEAFIRELAAAWTGIQSICVGANFTFGHKRGGNVELLKKLGAELKFSVHGMAAVSLDKKPVSSTRIREAIRAGELDTASQMLGRAYSVAAPVMEGNKLGRRLGFPTANLDTAGLALPPTGVYAIN